jgi:hypothetical protein
VDVELFKAATLVGQVMSRSTAQQLEHWARIGREVDAAASVSHHDIAAALAGRHDYDALTTFEQAIVRAEWEERLAERLASLDLACELEAEGRSFVELDEQGNVLHHPAATGADR